MAAARRPFGQRAAAVRPPAGTKRRSERAVPPAAGPGGSARPRGGAPAARSPQVSGERGGGRCPVPSSLPLHASRQGRGVGRAQSGCARSVGRGGPLRAYPRAAVRGVPRGSSARCFRPGDARSCTSLLRLAPRADSPPLSAVRARTRSSPPSALMRGFAASPRAARHAAKRRVPRMGAGRGGGGRPGAGPVRERFESKAVILLFSR